jgi:hypothetical protein
VSWTREPDPAPVSQWLQNTKVDMRIELAAIGVDRPVRRLGSQVVDAMTGRTNLRIGRGEVDSTNGPTDDDRKEARP